MLRIVLPSLLLTSLVVAPAIAAEPDATIPPIKEIQNAKPSAGVFKAATVKKPLVLKSDKDAAKHFDKKQLASLKKSVDFKQQIVLVFAWQGSGRDTLGATVAESYPEQITFTYKRGLTRDLRRHIRVYALRSNVKWSVK